MKSSNYYWYEYFNKLLGWMMPDKAMLQNNYSFSHLLKDLKLDLDFYGKVLFNLEKISFWKGIRILIKVPSFWLLAIHRYVFWVNKSFKNKLIKYFLKFFSFFARRLFEIITKSSIYNETVIGSGFCLAGKGGVTLGAQEIGKECTIYENVTIGVDLSRNRPVIGDYVKIYPNSIIYGGIRIGNNVVIKPSTVLTKSVPDYSIVQGNPGRIVRKSNH